MSHAPLPIFDSMQHLAKNKAHANLTNPEWMSDFDACLAFLKSYTGSLGTFNGYRREVERLLQWCWHIKKITLRQLKRDDIEQFVRFCQNPPTHWIGVKKTPRYILTLGQRRPNPEWRPFVAKISKAKNQQGEKPSLQDCALSQGAVQEIFAILSSLFNFLIAEEYVDANPVALIRQKSKFIRKRQLNAPIRRLSLLQWTAVLEASDALAAENPNLHERTRFMLNLLYGMYLRISELAASDRWIPTMNDFAKDSHGYWWFTTVGKGNKERQIAVSDAMLQALMRWRQFLGLSSLPTPADNSPLIPRIRGSGPMSDTAPIRRLIQQCFDEARHILQRQNLTEEAEPLAFATVHWLRHTGISEDVKTRPREHVRDDAGHSSSATTDRYIDVELTARYLSAWDKKIKPESEDEKEFYDKNTTPL